MSKKALVLWFSDVRRHDIGVVGGKNASLGEMIGRLKGVGIRVPPDFATTAEAYWSFIAANKLEDKIRATLSALEEDMRALAEQIGLCR